MLTAVDPAKHDAKRTRIRLATLDFRTEALPAHHLRLIGFPFWEHVAPPPPALAHPSGSRLGGTQSTRGLALAGTCHTNICPGCETIFWSSGAGPDTLSPWV